MARPPPRVLIFDDDLFLARDRFSDLGLELQIEANADRALEVTADFDPDFVLMDQNFRDSRQTGARAIAELRKVYAKEELHIVGISSDLESNVLLERAGANRTLRKAAVREFLHSIEAPKDPRR